MNLNPFPLHTHRGSDPNVPVVEKLLQQTKDARLLHFGLYSRGHKPFWSKGRVVLLGDAAHATLPHVGQVKKKTT